MTKIEDRKAVLLGRLSELDSRLHRIEIELEEPHNKDWEEDSVEHAADEVLENLGAAGQDEIRSIRAALQRIREGEYGFCTQCGAEISAERLDVLPATPFCKQCAAAH